jgi:periplasmic protein TonB
MLRTLLESQATRNRRAAGTAVSIGIHTAIVALAIVATARASSVSPGREHPDRLDPPIYRVLPPQPTHTERAAQHPGGSFVVPPVRPVLIAPVHVPTELPPIDLGRPAIDEHIWDGAHATLAIGIQGGGSLASPSSAVYTDRLVEKAAAPRPGNPAPLYPAPLRAAQLEGSVLARFVVDTTGRAEPASISFAEASHPQFAEAVRQALLRSRYLPAMLGGGPVRQLVEQRFAFTLTR